MQVNIRQISGIWDDGYALAKHTVSSTYICDDEFGHAQFDTKRSEPGEALFQLKYRNDWSRIDPIAAAIAAHVVPRFDDIGLIVPVPASHPRARQPVTEIALRLGRLIGKPVHENLIVSTIAADKVPLKNLTNRADKDAALAGRFTIVDERDGKRPRNILVVDDLFDSGASMDAVCSALRTIPEVGRLYVAAVSWK